MITFIISLAILILGYLFYGRFVERVFGPDDRVTPAIAKRDNVDFMVLPNWKVYMILRTPAAWRPGNGTT